MATDWPEARALALAAILPAGTDRYIALFDGNPIDGGTEITLAGYARVAHQDWSTSVPTPGQSVRSNLTDIVFPTVTEAGQADYWAIYDASVGGVLLRSSLVTDAGGVPQPVIFTGGGEEARFIMGELRIRAREE